MNLESLGNHASNQQSPEPKEAVRSRRKKINSQDSADRNTPCRGGACEVVWKPLAQRDAVTEVPVP